MTPREWDACWRQLRERRVVAAVALCAFLPAWMAIGRAGLLVGFVAVLAAYWRVRAFPCPRCRLPLVGVGFSSFPERCRSCGLLVFGHPDDVAASHAPAARSVRLSRRLRRLVAGSEIAGGAGAMLLTAFATAVPLWYVLLLQGLGGLTLAAGVWLWRDDARGYALSRALQLIQLVRVESAWILYAATAGFYVDLYHDAARVGINPGFLASLNLGIGVGLPFAVAVNLWAAALLLVLMHARPERPAAA